MAPVDRPDLSKLVKTDRPNWPKVARVSLRRQEDQNILEPGNIQPGGRIAVLKIADLPQMPIEETGRLTEEESVGSDEESREMESQDEGMLISRQVSPDFPNKIDELASVAAAEEADRKISAQLGEELQEETESESQGESETEVEPHEEVWLRSSAY